MRSIWKGAVSFGLVSIPVKLYAATEEKSVSFHQVHREDGGRIRYQRVCSVDGAEVSYGDIAKGYQLPSGEAVVLTDEDLADLPLSTSRAIDVVQFVPLDQVDPIYFTRSYYLEPDRGGLKPYVLLRQALEDSGRVALVKVALRQRESLATLRVRGGVFVLELMLWPDEVRAPEFGFLDEDVDVRPQELTMAGSLIDSLTADFDPSGFSDDYRAALEELIEAKIAGREVIEAPQPEEGGGGAVVDLMAALRASVAAARRDGGESATEGTLDSAERDESANRRARPTGGKKAPTSSKRAAAKPSGGAAAKKSAAGRPAKRAAAKKAGRRSA